MVAEFTWLVFTGVGLFRECFGVAHWGGVCFIWSFGLVAAYCLGFCGVVIGCW